MKPRFAMLRRTRRTSLSSRNATNKVTSELRPGSVVFEILDCALVGLGGLAGCEGAEVAGLAGARVFLSGVESVVAVGEFADHGCTSAGMLGAHDCDGMTRMPELLSEEIEWEGTSDRRLDTWRPSRRTWHRRGKQNGLRSRRRFWRGLAWRRDRRRSRRSWRRSFRRRRPERRSVHQATLLPTRAGSDLPAMRLPSPDRSEEHT